MSRAATGDTVTLKPSNNIYTVLLAVATVVQILGLIVICAKFQAYFLTNIFSS